MIMKKLTSSLGGVMFLISGLLTWLFMMVALIHWWGLLGFFASFIFTPGVVIFPFVFWIVEHQFPTTYFLSWGLGILGLIVMAMSDK
jgi:hypothetical protein